ncbi:MAG: tripartite tricarboxylate transporter substrate binding protein [Pseudomonadota bacterium]
MSLHFPIAKFAAALGALSLLVSAQAQDAATAYPGKPIRFVVPASAGGPSDVIARLVGERLSTVLGQPVLVENKPGASLMLGTNEVAKAAGDGYTLLFTTSTPIVMIPATLKNVPYDPLRELTTVAHLGSTPLVLYVSSAVAAKNVKELADLAKAKPGGLSYGSYGLGSSAHLLGEYMNKQLGIKMIHAPYKGVAPQLQDLAGGQITAGVADVGTASAFVKSGRIRPIAVTGTQRAKNLPDVPTFAEQGIVGMEPFSPWWGLFAPASTPRPVVDKLAAEIVKIVKSPDFAARFIALGGDPTGLSSAEANEMTRTEVARWRSIVGSLGDLKFE